MFDGLRKLPDYLLLHRPALIARAMECDTLLASDVVPDWNLEKNYGSPVGADAAAPDVPEVSEVTSGALAEAPDGTPRISVLVVPGPDTTKPPPAKYDLRHRLQGSGTWIDILGHVAALGRAYILGYTKGQSVEIQARAKSADGVNSVYTATTPHVVAASDPVIPPPTILSSLTDGFSTVSIEFRLPNWPLSDDDANLKGGQVWRAAHGAAFSTATRFPDSDYLLLGSGSATQTFSHIDVDMEAGDWDFYIVAQDLDGVRSSPAGPVNLVITDAIGVDGDDVLGAGGGDAVGTGA